MIVIGAGRVGSSLARRAEEVGETTVLVTRTEGWAALEGPPGDPILVAVRNDDLGDVVKRTPAFRRDDLVFVQNGMIRPWLRAHNVSTCTRGLLWFAAPERSGPITPGGTSPFCGAHALTMARWFVTLKIPAQVVDWAMFSARELEKLVWNTAFGLLCEVFDADVGTIARERRGELTSLVQELAWVGRSSMGVDIPIGDLVDRLVEYALSIPDYKGGVREWAWRDGWFEEVAASHGVPTPVHRSLLEAVGKGSLLP